MKIREIATHLEAIAPLRLAMAWDNVGLLLGDAEAKVKHILATIDVTPAVIEEAKGQKADLIISYHPCLWDPLKRITAQGSAASIYELIRSGISVYTVHTALDVASGGVNDGLADALGIVAREPLGDFLVNPAGPHYKLVTFVPVENLSKVKQAMYEAGAGRIGNYSHCGFETEGSGTFLPLAGAQPAIGKQGQYEHVAEVKIESVVAEHYLGAVIKALRQAHPYETPAFDVFRHYDMEKSLGIGRLGDLEKPCRVSELLDRLRTLTGAKTVGVVGPADQRVTRAAVCAGSCGKLIQRAIDQGCQFYVTGELKHHLALVAAEVGMTCVCLSHTVSERFILKKLINQLKKELSNVTIRLSAKDKDPFVWKNL